MTAVDELVAGADAFARSRALQMARAAGVPEHTDDLIAEARTGLAMAAARFDPNRGVLFLTYAQWWVKAQLGLYVDMFRRPVRFARNGDERAAAAKVKRAAEELGRELMRPPTFAEIADRIGCDIALVEAVIRWGRGRDAYVSTVDSPEDYESGRLTLAGGDSPDTLVDSAIQDARLRDAVARAVTTLTERERQVIRLRWLTEEPATHREVGEAMGFSYQRAQQIERRAFMKIRRALTDETRELLEGASP